MEKEMTAPIRKIKIEHDGVLHEAPVVLDETSVIAGVRRVSRQVAEWGGGSGPIQIISALHGARPFTADITNELSRLGVETNLHEIKVSNTIGTRGAAEPVLEFGQIPAHALTGAKTLIVDDIIDTSGTVNFIKKIALDARPADVRVAAVVNKYAAFSALSDFKIHDCALEKEKMVSREGKAVDYWLFGYGMDIGGKYRELKEIAWLEVER
jgi:hypoxanthine-guanine phosphoribosyltransferase